MATEYQHKRPNRLAYSSKGLMLYILPAPLILKLVICLLQGSISKFMIVGAALFFLYSGAYLNRLSLQRLATNMLRAKPKKIIDYRFYAMLFVGLGVLIISFLLIPRNISISLLSSLMSMLGFYLAYGLIQEKIEEIDLDKLPKATQKAIKTAYSDLEVIEVLGQRLDKVKDQSIKHNLDNVLTQSYKIMTLLTKTPEDASRARRFLSVYINRIKEILTQYIDLSVHNKEGDFREKLSQVLSEANKAFGEKESKLLDDDIFKLDIQLEVLDEQIKKEG